jgi:hypothetical protein
LSENILLIITSVPDPDFIDTAQTKKLNRPFFVKKYTYVAYYSASVLVVIIAAIVLAPGLCIGGVPERDPESNPDAK